MGAEILFTFVLQLVMIKKMKPRVGVFVGSSVDAEMPIQVQHILPHITYKDRTTTKKKQCWCFCGIIRGC